MSEVEETLERIKNHRGVEGYVIADRNVNVLRRHPQMQVAEAEKYALYMKELTTKARGVVRDLNPKNDLQYMRIRVKKLELLIAHEKDFLIVVIQSTWDFHKSPKTCDVFSWASGVRANYLVSWAPKTLDIFPSLRPKFTDGIAISEDLPVVAQNPHFMVARYLFRHQQQLPLVFVVSLDDFQCQKPIAPLVVHAETGTVLQFDPTETEKDPKPTRL